MARSSTVTRKPSKRLVASLEALRAQGVPFAPIGSLKPWKDNPRANAASVPRLVRLMNRYGWTIPIALRLADDMVIAGHTRLLAAEWLGLAEVPIVRLDHSSQEAIEYALADNRSVEMTPWDASKLPGALRDIDESVRSILGFDQANLQRVIGVAAHTRSLDVSSDAGLEGETDSETLDDLPTMPEETTIQVGDLFQLGAHRLLVGDATAIEDVRRLMDGERAGLVFTDPPYAIFGSSTGIAADISDDKMIRPFFRDVWTAIVEASARFAHFYVCCDWRSWSAWWETAKGSPASIRNMVVWDKGGGLGSSMTNCHELIAFGSIVPMKAHMKTRAGETGIRLAHVANVWRVNRVMKTEDGEDRKHNAQKPVALYEKAIEVSADPGGLVVDFFSGSGTCLVACEKTGRRARVMEIDPRYAQLSIDRWEKLTGEKAVKV